MKGPRANILDRAIAYVAPQAALMRAKARYGLAVSGQYDAGSERGSMASFNPRPGGPRSDSLPGLWKMRSRSRDLERNNALASGALATVPTNVVGTGIFPMPRLDADRLGLDPEAAAQIAMTMGAEFDLWADTTAADVTGEQDFWGLQDLVLRSQLSSGDVFTVPRFVERTGTPYELAIQVIEADRCRNPGGQADGTLIPGGGELVAGIEFDSYGAALAYWFSDKHPGELLASALRYERIPVYGANTGRRMAFQHFRRTRPGQVRGIPFLAPVIQLFKDLGRYTEAEIVAAVLSACFALSTKTEEGDGADLAGADDGDEGFGDGADRLRFLNPGLMANLAGDQTLTSFLPNRPNQAFDPFVQAMLRQIGVALEIPFEVLIKHFTASYSAARGALIEAWKMYRARRSWLNASFCQPYYDLWLVEAAAKGRVPDMPGLFTDPALFRIWACTEWIGPSQGELDELKAVNAAKTRVAEEFSTREEETARLTGGDWRQKHRQRAIEEALRRKDGTIIPDSIQERDTAMPVPADEPQDDKPGNEGGDKENEDAA